MTKKLFLLGSAALLTVVLAGCDSDPDEQAPDSPVTPAATTASVSPAASASARADEDEDDDEFPPQPSQDSIRAYVQDLREIDPDIIDGAGAEAVVTRGRAQCVQLYDTGQNAAGLRNSANVHFATEKHPEGFGDDKADKINVTVKKYICRTTWK